MFFKSKKKELLYRENVRVNCTPKSKEEVNREVGKMLVDAADRIANADADTVYKIL